MARSGIAAVELEIAFCFLCLALALVVPLYLLRASPKTLGNRELVSANTVFLITYMIYVGFSALIYISEGFRSFWAPIVSGPGYATTTFSVALWALIVYTAVYSFALKRFSAPTPKDNGAVPRIFWIVATVMILVGVVLRIYIIASLGGLEATAMRLSSGLRNAMGMEEISPSLVALRHISGVADAAALWAWLAAMKARRSRLLWTGVLVVVMALIYFTTAKRLYLLFPAIVIVVGVSRYIRRIGISSLPIAIPSVLVLGMFSLLYRSIVPSMLYGQNIDMRNVAWANGSILSFYFNSLEYTTFDMMMVAVNYSRDIADWFGGWLPAFYVSNIEPLFYIVPRFVWSDKPEVLSDISFAINWYVNRGGGGDPTATGWASTAIGSYWVTGGFMGLTLAMATIAVIASLADRKGAQTKSEGGILYYALMITVVFHLFRQGSIGWTFIIVVTQQLGLIAALLVLWVLSRPRSSLVRRSPAVASVTWN